ncbi:MAG: RNA polymerase sigma-70 factor [Bacteroidales bacterium]|nr:RNA polymerase sigma-70 factor [Bacteroidales bacterium]
MPETSDEKHLIQKVKRGNIFAFEKLFKSYYRNLCLYAEFYVREKAMAEEVVSNFFMKLWENRNNLDIKDSVKAYFYKSIYYQCIKYLEHLRVMKKYEDYAQTILENKELFTPSANGYPLANLISAENLREIEKAIENLPEKCREIFCLCRFENMSYDEAAAKLNISVNTVRTQMTRAMSKLREALRDYLPALILYFFFNLPQFLSHYFNTISPW